jgi:branched-chain amino acid transport system substrate-binding protein
MRWRRKKGSAFGCHIDQEDVSMRRILLAAALGFLATTPTFAAEPIKIGLSGPFSGGSSSGGISMRDGIKLAADEINKAGGLLGGRPIELIVRDDQSKNEIGVQVAQELINKEHVVATVGFVNTGVALASHRFYQEAGIPVLVCASTGTIITQQFLPPAFEHNYVFRNVAHDGIQSVMIAEETVKRQGFKKPAIMADTTNYGKLGRADLTKALADLGVTPVVSEKFNVGDTDMTAQILRAKEAGADVILTYAIGPEAAQVANAMAKLGWKVPIIGSWALSATGFIDTAGPNGEGAMMPQTFIQLPTTPKRKAFIDAYKAAYKIDRMNQAVAAAQGYDAVYILAAAIAQTGSTDGPKIRAALEDLKTKVEGVVTTYEKPFSPTDHEAMSTAIPVFGKIQNGWVVPAHPEELEGAKAVRLKSKS